MNILSSFTSIVCLLETEIQWSSKSNMPYQYFEYKLKHVFRVWNVYLLFCSVTFCFFFKIVQITATAEPDIPSCSLWSPFRRTVFSRISVWEIRVWNSNYQIKGLCFIRLFWLHIFPKIDMTTCFRYKGSWTVYDLQCHEINWAYNWCSCYT